MRAAVVIGGGFYGTAIAAHLATRHGMRDVLLVEREDRLFARASWNNQARVHTGYHYPRSFTTAFRSNANRPAFMRDYGAAVETRVTKLYAIASRQSKVAGRQFERFCREVGIPLAKAPRDLRALFDPRLVEAVYLAEESVFDAGRLAALARQALSEAGVETRLGTRAVAVSRADAGLAVRCASGSGESVLHARLVFNCGYSGINRLGGDFPGTATGLKHEIAELALVRVPSVLRELGVTVMDGPFFSLMPFPPRGLHTLSHVRYTPHGAWMDAPEIDPYRRLAEYHCESRVERMLRDAARFLPAVRDCVAVDSMFEIKTVLTKNEGDDGRPILFERHAALPGCFSVLGGKIDNIYDVIERIDAAVREAGVGARKDGSCAH